MTEPEKEPPMMQRLCQLCGQSFSFKVNHFPEQVYCGKSCRNRAWCRKHPRMRLSESREKAERPG